MQASTAPSSSSNWHLNRPSQNRPVHSSPDRVPRIASWVFFLSEKVAVASGPLKEQVLSVHSID